MALFITLVVIIVVTSVVDLSAVFLDDKSTTILYSDSCDTEEQDKKEDPLHSLGNQFTPDDATVLQETTDSTSVFVEPIALEDCWDDFDIEGFADSLIEDIKEETYNE